MSSSKMHAKAPAARAFAPRQARPARAWRHQPKSVQRNFVAGPAGHRLRCVHCRVYTEDTVGAPKSSIDEVQAQIADLGKQVREQLQGTSIYLLGMMGSGKSTTGRLLASSLDYYFFDTDSVIEDAAGGATVSEIFDSNGEEGFRELESAVLTELSSYRDCVVATGGGIVTRKENWGQMQTGVTVYLEGPPRLLAERVVTQDGAASRPLLAGKPGEAQSLEDVTAKLTGLQEAREAAYQNADCQVSLCGPDGGVSSTQMVLRILISISAKIKASAAERLERSKGS